MVVRPPGQTAPPRMRRSERRKGRAKRTSREGGCVWKSYFVCGPREVDGFTRRPSHVRHEKGEEEAGVAAQLWPT